MRVISRKIGLVDYESCWEAMRSFNKIRTSTDLDEIWSVEHFSVYTLGKTFDSGGAPFSELGIPVVKSDRGGKITYHGRGQLILYVLLNVRRMRFGPKELVISLERGIIDYLLSFGIVANGRRDAPGVYVRNKKIASLGLRFANGSSYHGLALNVDMDMAPFEWINPCGIEGLSMTQLSDLGVKYDLDMVSAGLRQKLYDRLYPGSTVSEILAEGFPGEV